MNLQEFSQACADIARILNYGKAFADYVRAKHIAESMERQHNATQPKITDCLNFLQSSSDVSLADFKLAHINTGNLDFEQAKIVFEHLQKNQYNDIRAEDVRAKLSAYQKPRAAVSVKKPVEEFQENSLQPVSCTNRSNDVSHLIAEAFHGANGQKQYWDAVFTAEKQIDSDEFIAHLDAWNNTRQMMQAIMLDPTFSKGLDKGFLAGHQPYVVKFEGSVHRFLGLSEEEPLPLNKREFIKNLCE